MKIRLLNFRYGESHFPVRTTLDKINEDCVRHGVTPVVHGLNRETRTGINECIDLTRVGTQHTYSGGPTVEIIEPEYLLLEK